MRHTPQEIQTEFLAWLQDCRVRVHAFEKAAADAASQGDDTAYRKAMQDKAELLQGLFTQAEQQLRSLSGSVKEFPLTTLQRFSHNAASALRIGSVFFMSALLFPDDHKAGEPNDLDTFAQELAKAWE